MIELQKTKYPPGVNGDGINCIYPDFEDELRDCIEKSGNAEKFCGKLNQRIKWILETGPACVQKRDWTEALKHDPKHILYSIKFKDKENVRIIFIFTEQGPLFLSAFKEKKDYSYSDGMETAHKRLNKLIEAELVEEESILCHNQ